MLTKSELVDLVYEMCGLDQIKYYLRSIKDENDFIRISKNKEQIGETQLDRLEISQLLDLLDIGESHSEQNIWFYTVPPDQLKKTMFKSAARAIFGDNYEAELAKAPLNPASPSGLTVAYFRLAPKGWKLKLYTTKKRKKQVSSELDPSFKRLELVKVRVPIVLEWNEEIKHLQVRIPQWKFEQPINELRTEVLNFISDRLKIESLGFWSIARIARTIVEEQDSPNSLFSVNHTITSADNDSQFAIYSRRTDKVIDIRDSTQSRSFINSRKGMKTEYRGSTLAAKKVMRPDILKLDIPFKAYPVDTNQILIERKLTPEETQYVIESLAKYHLG